MSPINSGHHLNIVFMMGPRPSSSPVRGCSRCTLPGCWAGCKKSSILAAGDGLCPGLSLLFMDLLILGPYPLLRWRSRLLCTRTELSLSRGLCRESCCPRCGWKAQLEDSSGEGIWGLSREVWPCNRVVCGDQGPWNQGVPKNGSSDVCP